MRPFHDADGGVVRARLRSEAGRAGRRRLIPGDRTGRVFVRRPERVRPELGVPGAAQPMRAARGVGQTSVTVGGSACPSASRPATTPGVAMTWLAAAPSIATTPTKTTAAIACHEVAARDGGGEPSIPTRLGNAAGSPNSDLTFFPAAGDAPSGSLATPDHRRSSSEYRGFRPSSSQPSTESSTRAPFRRCRNAPQKLPRSARLLRAQMSNLR